MSSLTAHRILSNFRHFLPSLAFPRVSGATYKLPWLSAPGQGHRHVYTRAALGLDQYMKLREDTSSRFENIKDAFKGRMRTLLSDQEGAMIFTEDFKNVLHMAEDTPEDMAMIREMAQRFNRQHEGLRFGMYVFGPVVMRTYHTLRQAQEALEALADPKLDGFFDQMTTYQICLDLLYKAGLYTEVGQVFAEVQEKRLAGHRYPKSCLNIAVAACYKIGTQESLVELQTLLSNTEQYGIPLNRRLLVFGAALALKTNNAHTALDFILRSKAVTHISVRSIKVIALSQMGQLADALVALRAIVEIDVPHPAPGTQGKYILKEAVDEVEVAVETGGNKEQKVEFERIKKYLMENGAISDKSLDEVVCTPIDRFEKKPGQERAMLQAAFNSTSPRQHRSQQHYQHRSPPYRPPRRQGLMDME